MALGFGFRCGFLGLLHLEIVFERLQRHFDLDVITTAPSVIYRFTLQNGEVVTIDNVAHYPDPSTVELVEEPWVKCHIMAPADFLGAIMSLGMEKRGSLEKTETMDAKRLLLTYRFPLNEIITDLSDKLKSITRGYASFDYEFDCYAKSDIVKLEIRVNEEPVDAFSCLVHRSKAEGKGRAICKKLVEVIPMQQFKVPIQAAIGGKSHRPRNDPRAHEKRHRQMLRRRHHPQTQTLGKTKRRQEAHEGDRQSQHPSIGLHGSLESRRMKAPRVGVAVVVIQDGKILLGKRKGSLAAGQWSCAGGHLEFGESVEDCMHRELEEETSLKILSYQLGSWVSTIFDSEHHYITLITVVTAFEGIPQLREPDKCEGWEWFPLKDLPSPLFPTVKSWMEDFSSIPNASGHARDTP